MEIMIPHISIQMHSLKFNSLMQIMIISSWSTRSSSKIKASRIQSLAQKKRKKGKGSPRLLLRKEKKVKKAYLNPKKKRRRNSQDTS